MLESLGSGDKEACFIVFFFILSSYRKGNDRPFCRPFLPLKWSSHLNETSWKVNKFMVLVSISKNCLVMWLSSYDSHPIHLRKWGSSNRYLRTQTAIYEYYKMWIYSARRDPKWISYPLKKSWSMSLYFNSVCELLSHITLSVHIIPKYFD